MAQQRFATVPVATPIGEVHPCLGVYTVDAVAAGAYARTSVDGLVDGRAADTAVLIGAAELAGEEIAAGMLQEVS